MMMMMINLKKIFLRMGHFPPHPPRCQQEKCQRNAWELPKWKKQVGVTPSDGRGLGCNILVTYQDLSGRPHLAKLKQTPFLCQGLANVSRTPGPGQGPAPRQARGQGPPQRQWGWGVRRGRGGVSAPHHSFRRESIWEKTTKTWMPRMWLPLITAPARETMAVTVGGAPCRPVILSPFPLHPPRVPRHRLRDPWEETEAQRGIQRRPAPAPGEASQPRSAFQAPRRPPRVLEKRTRHPRRRQGRASRGKSRDTRPSPPHTRSPACGHCEVARLVASFYPMWRLGEGEKEASFLSFFFFFFWCF